MKAIKIIFLSLACLFAIAAVAVFVVIKTFNLNTYLPRITQAASDALGRQVSIDRAGLDFSWPGVAVDAIGIRVAGEPLMEADKVHARLDLMPFLRQREIHVHDIVISGIRVNAGDARTPLNIRVPRLEVHVNGFSLDVPLRVSGDAFFADGRLENFNILKTVLGRVNIIPGLGEQIEGFLSDKMKAKLGGDDTVLDKAQVRFRVEGRQVFIDDASVQSKIFEARAQGIAAFDGTVGVDMAVSVEADLSAHLARSVPPLEGLLDAEKKIYVPGRVSGKAPDISYGPDMEYLGKKIVSGEGVKQITKQLGKVLEKNPEVKAIISDVLNNIFK